MAAFPSPARHAGRWPTWPVVPVFQARLFDEILRVQDGRWVYWLEVEEYQRGRPAFVDWALKKAPLRVGPHLHRKIYSRSIPIIFTSATLTTAERRFEFFADRLG